MYKIIRNILFLFPPEEVHHFSMSALHWACRLGPLRSLLRKMGLPGSAARLQGAGRNERSGGVGVGRESGVSRASGAKGTERELFGLVFRNPVGLGAGFDKNALYLPELDILGFGFVEIGTVTPFPQAGNERPRLFRLPKDRALINRMGFNNDGVKAVAGRLRDWRKANAEKTSLIVGGNIGKNKATPNEDAWKDYEICFRELFDCVDYFVVNVSSPNTPGLRELQEKESLRKILSHLQTLNGQYPRPKPILLKIAPDLGPEQLDDVIDLALEIRLDGLVATNTTISRDTLQATKQSEWERIGAGGLSGSPLKEKSTAFVRHIHEKTGGALPVIASGGIFTGADAREKMAAGASLVQVWTGFIYEGPFIAGKITAELAK